MSVLDSFRTRKSKTVGEEKERHFWERIAPCGGLVSGAAEQIKVGRGWCAGLWSSLLCAKRGCVPALLWRCAFWALSQGMPVFMPTCCLLHSETVMKRLKYLVHLLLCFFLFPEEHAQHVDLTIIVKRWYLRTGGAGHAEPELSFIHSATLS